MKRLFHVITTMMCFLALCVLVGCDATAAEQQDGKPGAGSQRNVTRQNDAPVYSKWPFGSDEAVRRQDETAKALGISKTLTLKLGAGVTMDLVLIPAGKFAMGSPETEQGRHSGDYEQQEVTVSRAFYIGRTEVTQAQWRAVMATSPWNGQEYAKEGDDYPAARLSWDQASTFCKELPRKGACAVRLPTQAEWEYACRAGTETRFSYGDDPNYHRLGDYAWFDHNAWDRGEKYAHRVATKKANAWGLFDMHGNAEEWCEDWATGPTRRESGTGKPPPPPAEVLRILKGGAWDSFPSQCRSSHYRLASPDTSKAGFRIVASPGASSRGGEQRPK